MLWEIFYNLSGYNTKYVHIYIYIYIYIVYTLLKCSRSSFSFLLPQRASLKRDSRPNLYVCMYIYIYIYIYGRWNLDRFGVFRPTIVHCFRVGRLYSCLINRQIGNAIIIRGAFTIIRGAFAIIRSGSSIIRGAFNIISIYSFHVYDFTIA
jgi:hypothetical protein